MNAMGQSWTDKRLDDFRDDVGRRFDFVDQRFDQVDQRFDRVEAELRDHRVETRTEFKAVRVEIKFGFERVDERFESLYRLMMTLGGIVIAALIGLIATQL